MHRNILLVVVIQVCSCTGLLQPASRACVVGAGFAGLATSRHMKEYGVNFTAFEATRYIGGTWRFDPHVGTDEDGLPLFTSMYKHFRTNIPRQTMEFSGFPFPEGTPSFPSRTCYYSYLKLFAKHFDLLKHIQLRSVVNSIKWANDHWNLTYMKTDTGDNHTEACDFVVIATGQNSFPFWPTIEGLDRFEGQTIHSHDYKEPETYRNRRVLIVGAGASGLDLAIQLSNVTAKLVHSHHVVYNQPYFSSTYVHKPDITEFTAKGAIFQDGSFEEVDDVILCTGYNYNHAFLDENTGVMATNKFVLPLYQNLVNIDHPSMTFVGISKSIINRVLDAQGEYSAALAAGKFHLPSEEEMLQQWFDQLQKLQSDYKKVNYILDIEQYFATLTQEASVSRAPQVLLEITHANNMKLSEDLLNYRDYDYEIKDDYNYVRKYNPREGFPCPIEN